jgi:hypothetical protein
MFREMSPEIFWLLCWSVGGLIVMSLIPSKRVDRIFPVIPPLCLLLAAQIKERRLGQPSVLHVTAGKPSFLEEWSYRWTAFALVFAVLFTGGYTVWKIVTGCRDHRNALAHFGRNVRYEAEARHWRYEVVSAKDEGLLLYLQKTHFVKPVDAVAEWKAGNLDALVVSKEKASALMRDLEGASLSKLKLHQRERQGGRYVLISR